MRLLNESRFPAEHEVTKLLQLKDTLIQEVQHRVANNLQIIAAILMLQSQTAQSAETRLHLQGACHRILSVATLHRYLQASEQGEKVELGPFLRRLCDILVASMVGDNRSISLQVDTDVGSALPDDAVSIGLIITELVTNSLKYAFPSGAEGEVSVRFGTEGLKWRFSVTDNGIGLRKDGPVGLGTSIVGALAAQLNAQIETFSSSHGTTVSITHLTSDRERCAPDGVGDVGNRRVGVEMN
jgi:two-component sensor histidine kinase